MWLYPFLARQAPVRSEILVVEGWMKEGLLDQALAWAESNGVTRIYTTGGPIEAGSRLAEWKTYAELAKGRLDRRGAGKHFDIVAAPAAEVRRGRTRESARALKAMMGMERGAFTLASKGPHMRRSWRAYQAEFGSDVEVGSLALVPADYGEADWWKRRKGVQDVAGQTLCYLYDLLSNPGIAGEKK